MSDQEVDSLIQLFAAIEGGYAFWSRENSSRGAQETLQRIRASQYSESENGIVGIRKRLELKSAAQLQEEIVQAGGFFLTPADHDWPAQLNDLVAPPLALVGKGERTCLSVAGKSLAIVGTRNPTDYGKRIAGDFALAAVERDWCIVSGGAYGIDAVAHQGALTGSGVTMAILAGGLDFNYPAGNQRLFEEIALRGLLLSEVMPSVRAEPFRFLTRNRLIAALSQGTIVVEAAYRSGSLRTAREAADLMRLVMAVPGAITSPASEGCHRLIAERSAELVTSIAEVMELVNPLGSE